MTLNVKKKFTRFHIHSFVQTYKLTLTQILTYIYYLYLMCKAKEIKKIFVNLKQKKFENARVTNILISL